jgi:hypothetical protein
MIDEKVDVVIRLIVLDLRGKHGVVTLAYLSDNIGKGIVGQFAGNIELLRFVVIFENGFRKGRMGIVKQHFSIGAVVNQIIFVGFDTYFL